jgi:NADH:ubiquinone oxidoreductase subunit F (NADH-binding)/NADH:ubiquinone oxidoreductase subunit E
MHQDLTDHQSLDPEIAEVAALFQHHPQAVLAILKEVQLRRGGLSRKDITQVAQILQIPPEKAYGVATFYSMLTTPVKTIRLCDGPACWLNNAGSVRAALDNESSAEQRGNGHSWTVIRSSCLGLCDRSPAALIANDQCGPVTAQSLAELTSGWLGEMPSYKAPLPNEVRILLEHAGEIDPESITSALSYGGYDAAQKSLEWHPRQVLTELERSGLRGRGGAGYPIGRKLRFVAEADHNIRYVVCNADESEPLTFKDRVLIDTNPQKILEGMLIAAYAVGAEQGFIYIRGEYECQARRLESAIRQAEEIGWLGKNIRGGEFSFSVHLHRGAGAYICGEETALLESLEGKRGEPRARPPYPVQYGYLGKPTAINNVETFAAIPSIVKNGAEWYQSIGDRANPGTKLYTLCGHVNRPGLFEAPYGLTLRQIIQEFGGGMLPESDFNFALTGGAAGTIVSDTFLDVPIDYSSIRRGLALGSGAFLICDQSVSPVALLRELMYFFAAESCGKCTPCRIGTKRALVALDRIIAEKGLSQEAKTLEDLVPFMRDASLCGLGQTAVVPIETAMKNFPHLFVPGRLT